MEYIFFSQCEPAEVLFKNDHSKLGLFGVFYVSQCLLDFAEDFLKQHFACLQRDIATALGNKIKHKLKYPVIFLFKNASQGSYHVLF